MQIAQRGRAPAVLDWINRAIIRAAGDRQCGRLGRVPGDRPAASIAGAPVRLEVITEPRAGGTVEPVTPVGYKTARRRQARMLARLPAGDPRLIVADRLADAIERVGSVAGAALDGGASPTNSGVPDGGATTRIKHAARLARIEAAANGWVIERGGKVLRGRPRVILAPRQQARGRQEIQAFAAIVAVCVDGKSAADILAAHGWKCHDTHRRAVVLGVLETLGAVAEAMGLAAKNA